MKNSLCALCTLALALLALPANAQQEENPTVTIDGTVYTINGDEASLTNGNKEATGEFIIPSEVEYEGRNYPVTAVGDYAFYDWSGRKVEITSVSIPPSVASIGESAFGNTMITEVEIPETVKILKGAFYKCTALTSAVVKGGQEAIGGVFDGCVALESAVIGEGHSVVPTNMFFGCSSLKDVSLPSTLMEIGGGIYGSGAFSGCSSLESIEIPASVRSIGIGAFSNSGLVEVTLPEGLESLEASAFSNCKQLMSVKLPTSISYLPEQLFLGCSSLASIELPDNIKELRGSTWSTGCFGSCSALKEVNLGSVGIIGNYTFYNCTALKEITLPSTVVSLGESVFSYCASLESIEIGSSLESMADNCFEGCESLVSINVNPGNAYFSTIDGVLCNAGKTELLLAPKNLSGTFTVPASVTKLNDYIFSGCRSLTGLKLNEGLQSIGANVIFGCENLSELTIPSSVSEISLPYAFSGNSLTSFVVNGGNPYYSSNAGALCSKEGDELLRWVLPQSKIVLPEEITVVGEGAFAYIGAEEIVLPSGLKVIKNDAFNWCAIKEIELPESLTEIGNSAFSGCQGLVSVKVPDGVYVIGSYAFSRCSGLKELILPSGLREIPEGMCQQCSQLSDIVIPNTVANIADNAFVWCSINRIVIPESVVKIGNSSFNCSYYLNEIEALPLTPPVIEASSFGSMLEKVYVKAEAFDAYKAAEHWSRFNIVSLDEVNGIQGIENDNFQVNFWTVYGIDGRKVLETGDYTGIQNLNPGLYIINGKKQIIR